MSTRPTIRTATRPVPSRRHWQRFALAALVLASWKRPREDAPPAAGQVIEGESRRE